ncbi:protease inhibitor Inh/omp19 family protein [Sinorhizobium meliloti]|uniref:protease inhibitor Inh/omp19 family protein n=1 Tax=Rhizobium meliloti TaxID=382 RepID=UPI00399B9163
MGGVRGWLRTALGGWGAWAVSRGAAARQAEGVTAGCAGQVRPPAGAAQVEAAPTTGTGAPGAAAGTEVGAATNALDVTKESMVGNWRVSSAGSSCDMFLTLTNLGSGSRGGTRGCAGELTAMGSWEVAGKQVVLKDRSGNPIARLYKTADARFDGSTNGGQPVSLSR